MSSLFDKCNEEFAKLRAKGRDMFFPAESSSRVEPDSEQGFQGPSSIGYLGLGQVLRIKQQQVAPICSEAALSMLVDCVSP